MALTNPQSSETTLVGRIVQQSVTSTSDTIYAQFEDKKTGVAREPQADTLVFTLSKDDENFEIILASSHSTSGGITTINVAKSGATVIGRDVLKYGNLVGQATGNKHPVNREIGCADIHVYTEIINQIIRGAEATGSNIFRVGDETDSDIYWYFNNADATPPYIKYDAAGDIFVYAPDGVSENPFTGTGSISAGEGLDLTGGVLSAKGAIQATSADTTADYLDAKLTVSSGAGAIVTKSLVNPSGNESINIDVAFNAATLDSIANRDNSYTPAYLTSGGNVFSTFGLWTAVTDGAFQMTIDAGAVSVTGLDFSSVTSMGDVVLVMQTGIRTVTGSTETCTWSGTAIVISSADETSSSAITVTTAGASGTDISGAGANSYMDCDVGNGVVTAAALNIAGDAGKLVEIDTGGYINDDLITLPAPNVNVYTSDDTWTKPAGLSYVVVEVVGGGGGGGGVTNDDNAAGGGGGGGYSREVIAAATLGATEAVTVGTGGAGGIGGSTGSAGVTSSFGALLQATGGGGGGTATSGAVEGAAGGVGSGGDINAAGDDGGTGSLDVTFSVTGAYGGGTVLGGSTKGQYVATTAGANGEAGSAYGGGGSGAVNADNNDDRTGGAGADGVVIVTEY